MSNEQNKGMSILGRFFMAKESGIIVVTLLFAITISIINPVFISISNLFNVFRATGFTLVTALGMTCILIAGGLDLSVGSVLALGGCIGGIAMTSLGLNMWLSILIGCASGLIIGLINGIVIVKLRIPPIIMTLGMMYIARGIVNIVTLGVPIYPLPAEFQSLEQVDLFGVPKVVLIAIVLAFLAHFFLKYTTIGRSIYAIGGNRETARLAGIDMPKITVICYCICSTLAALTGVIMASRLGSAQPSAGNGYEMTVIAAAIIGGTSTDGGSGTILGTVVGALFMNILTNAMTVMKVSVYWQNFAVGIILVLAVALDQYRRDRMTRIGLDKT